MSKGVPCKMLIIVVFLIQLGIGVLTQGVFEPSHFTEGSCSGLNQWTRWFDSGNPSITLGEFEVTTHIQQVFAGFMCPIPIAIQVIIFYFNLIFVILKNKTFSIRGSYNTRRRSNTN